MDPLQTVKNDILKIWGREPRSLDELAECTIKVINQHVHRDVDKSPVIELRTKVAGFKWHVSYGRVSNSHQRPIGGVTNWWGTQKIGEPLGYQGWQGRVWIRYQKELRAVFSDPFKKTLTYPGTGGGGAYDGPWKDISKWHYMAKRSGSTFDCPEPCLFSWDYRFFSSDWPELNYYDLFEKIQGTDFREPHTYEWNDPEILCNDIEFINWCLENPDVMALATK